MTEFSIHQEPRPDATNATMTVYAMAQLRPVNYHVAVRAPTERFETRDDAFFDKIDARLAPHLRVYRAPFSVVDVKSVSTGPEIGLHITTAGGEPSTVSTKESNIGYIKVGVTGWKYITTIVEVPRGAENDMIELYLRKEFRVHDREYRKNGVCIDYTTLEWSFDHMVIDG